MKPAVVVQVPGGRLQAIRVNGVREPVFIQAMPLADFPQDIEAGPGALIEFSVDADSVGVGQVFEVDDRRVKVEFNHPLIGNNLRFDVEVLAVIERCT